MYRNMSKGNLHSLDVPDLLSGKTLSIPGIYLMNCFLKLNETLAEFVFSCGRYPLVR